MPASAPASVPASAPIPADRNEFKEWFRQQFNAAGIILATLAEKAAAFPGIIGSFICTVLGTLVMAE